MNVRSKGIPLMRIAGINQAPKCWKYSQWRQGWNFFRGQEHRLRLCCQQCFGRAWIHDKLPAWLWYSQIILADSNLSKALMHCRTMQRFGYPHRCCRCMMQGYSYNFSNYWQMWSSLSNFRWACLKRLLGKHFRNWHYCHPVSKVISSVPVVRFFVILSAR